MQITRNRLLSVPYEEAVTMPRRLAEKEAEPRKLELEDVEVFGREGGEDEVDVDDGFGGEGGDRGAADVVDCKDCYW